MAVEEQSIGHHNRMLGQRIKHPKSTNFEDEYPIPPPKRLKHEESLNESSHDVTDNDDGNSVLVPSTKVVGKTIPDSEPDEEDEDFPPPASQTELESALPPISIDKEAISAYEAARAAEDTGVLDLKGRLGQRKWIQGKSSIYVDAFNLALETVLEDEDHLFNSAEKGVFDCWRTLSYEAQYL